MGHGVAGAAICSSTHLSRPMACRWAMLAGVGTILFPEQVDQVVKAGAAFGVAPGTNPVVIRRAEQRKLPFAPGVATPTDIDVAVQAG